MLTITVLGNEFFDEEKEEFVTIGDYVLELEHSLVSISKWESIFEKPFLANGEKTDDEVLAYIKAMVLTPNVPPEVFLRLSQDNFDDIQKYLDAKMTATWFSEINPSPKSREIITNELIYYWMNSLSIPLEMENWHINRLFTLIKIHSLKNAKPEKMSRGEAAARQRELNEQRKAKHNTRG